MRKNKLTIDKPTFPKTIGYFALRFGVVAIIIILICVIGSKIYYKNECKTTADNACEKVYNKAEEYWKHYLRGTTSNVKRNEIRLDVINLWEEYRICSAIGIDDTLYISSAESAYLECSGIDVDYLFFLSREDAVVKLNSILHCIALEGYDYRDCDYILDTAYVNWGKRSFVPRNMRIIDQKNKELIMEVDLSGSYPSYNTISANSYSTRFPMHMSYAGNPDCDISDFYNYIGDITLGSTYYIEDKYSCGYLSDRQDLNPHDVVISKTVRNDTTGEEFLLEMKSDYSYISKIYEHKANVFGIVSTLITIVVYVIACLIGGFFRFYKQQTVYDLFEHRRQTTDAMAHDLKTPLSIASAYVENLKENINEDKKEQYLNSIDESIKYMNRLINDILEFSNSQFSEGTLNINETNVRTHVEKIKEMLAPVGERRGLKFKIEGNISVKTDAELLEQSLLNLLGNAVKYASSKSTIDIKIDEKAITIQNKFDGEIKNIDRLLEPYVKGDTYRGENTGSGLGLAIADINLNKLGYKLSVDVSDKVFTATIQLR